MQRFFQFNFIFDRYPTGVHLLTFYVILAVFIIALIIGFYSAFLANKKVKNDKIIAKFYNKLSNWGLWCGVIGLLITFFRYERSPYLGMRIWSILWLLIYFFWLAYLLKYLIIELPKQRTDFQKKKEFEKYLPK